MFVKFTHISKMNTADQICKSFERSRTKHDINLRLSLCIFYWNSQESLIIKQTYLSIVVQYISNGSEEGERKREISKRVHDTSRQTVSFNLSADQAIGCDN